MYGGSGPPEGAGLRGPNGEWRASGEGSGRREERPMALVGERIPTHKVKYLLKSTYLIVGKTLPV